MKKRYKGGEREEDFLEHRTDGTDAFDTLYIGCETVCANESRVELAQTMPSAADIMQHRTDGTDAFVTLYIGCEKFPYRDAFSVNISGVL